MDINMTLLGEVITFLLFVLFTMKFIWPPVVKAMQERQQKIADGLASAERGKHDLELAKNKAVEILHESRSDADQLIEKANIRADQMINEAKSQGRVESQRIISDAQVEIAHEVTNAKTQLKTEMAHFVLQGAEKILSKEIDAHAHEKMLDELITEIE